MSKKNKLNLFSQHVADILLIEKAKFVSKTLTFLSNQNAYKNTGLAALWGLMMGPAFKQIGNSLVFPNISSAGNVILGVSAGTILFLLMTKKYFYKTVDPAVMERMMDKSRDKQNRVNIYKEMDELYKLAGTTVKEIVEKNNSSSAKSATKTKVL